jgi:hypothetical protein
MEGRMKKVKLNLEDLDIESFETVAAAGPSGTGTVAGHFTLACSEEYTCDSCSMLTDCEQTEGQQCTLTIAEQTDCGATCGQGGSGQWCTGMSCPSAEAGCSEGCSGEHGCASWVC